MKASIVAGLGSHCRLALARCSNEQPALDRGFCRHLLAHPRDLKLPRRAGQTLLRAPGRNVSAAIVAASGVGRNTGGRCPAPSSHNACGTQILLRTSQRLRGIVVCPTASGSSIHFGASMPLAAVAYLA